MLSRVTSPVIRLPILRSFRSAGRIVGVLDIDSPVLNRFSEEDEKGLSDLVMCIGDKVDFDGLRG